MENNIQLVKVSPEHFEGVKWDLLHEHGINTIDEEIAFTCMWEGEAWIFINEGTWEDLDYDEQKIVIAHETAHATGIKSEEKADIWALDVLNTKQKTMLINMWEVRHGHNYESYT